MSELCARSLARWLQATESRPSLRHPLTEKERSPVQIMPCAPRRCHKRLKTALLTLQGVRACGTKACQEAKEISFPCIFGLAEADLT